MREQEFRNWFEQQGAPQNTIQSRTSNLIRVEGHHGDLDAAFDQDGLKELIGLFKYSTADEINGRPSPTPMPINGNLRTNLGMYKGAIGLYQKFREETAGGPLSLDAATLSAPLAQTKKLLSLEHDMQVLLRSNIEQLEAGLVIIDSGMERPVTSGRIDITAKDVGGAIVVIELKIGKAGREAIGQILGYMSDIVEEEGNTPVRGMLVAGSFDTSALSAVRIVPRLSLKKYAVSFQFSDG